MKMNFCFLVFLVLPILFFNAPAFAAIYRLEIRQVNPDGPTYSVLCDDRMGICSVDVPFVTIRPRTENEISPLETGVVMTKHDAYFRFKWKDVYLFTRQAGDSYMRIVGYPSGKPEKVRLYLRGETESLAELEIKFLLDTQPPPPDKPRAPAPSPQKQPI